ncbi:MAG TPA: hypothetical protein VHC01_07295 [Gaiellaceae bacterium]|jgi:hypothetical protein|nr:hypothetical protein [Gaiellaceae bacterium]
MREPTPGRTFGRVADAYARTRPRYQPAALERAAAELAQVVAVEPDEAMRARFDGEIPDDEREAIACRAYPLMDDVYELRVVTYLYWRLLPCATR